VYDKIGEGYVRHRQPDPRLVERFHAALGSARSVLNVGAGAGSYEPDDRTTVAVEPSDVMLAQRPPGAAPGVKARAEALPFVADAFDAVMALLTVHHWSDHAAGLAECVRVARDRVVLFTCDPDWDGFWLVQEYLPEFLAHDRAQLPTLNALTSGFGAECDVTITPVPIPHDCADGFLGAYWRRPEAYLDPSVRAGISSFVRMPHAAVKLEALRDDLASGVWQERNRSLFDKEELDIGYRLVVAQFTPQRA
jgi:SAM-dependent methyltransferase